MANHKATGKKSAKGPELVQRVRAAILAALDATEKKGKKISEVLAEEFEKNPLKFMELASKYCPKDLSIEIDDARSRVEEFDDDELADIAAAGRRRTAKAPRRKAQVH